MPDNLPIISRSRMSPHAYHAFGFSAHGYQLSTVIGKIMSPLILDDQTDLPMEPLSIEHFQPTGDLQHLRPKSQTKGRTYATN